MSYILTGVQFAGKIKSISSNKQKLSDDVHAALIGATYLCLKNSGGTTPFQQILDAVGTTAHRQGITQWIETYAPVLLRDGVLKLNKTAWKELDTKAICEGFDAYVESTGMDAVRWDSIAAEKNTTVSVFDVDKTVDNFLKKLDKEGLNLLAAKVREAVLSYNATIAKIEA